MKLRDYLKTANGLIKIGSGSGFFYCGDVDLLDIDEISNRYLTTLIGRRDKTMEELRAASTDRIFQQRETMLKSYQDSIDNWIHFADREVVNVYHSTMEDAEIVIIKGSENGKEMDCGTWPELEPEKMPEENALAMVSAIYKDVAQALVYAYKKKEISLDMIELYKRLLEESRKNLEEAEALIRQHREYFNDDPYHFFLKLDSMADECKRRAHMDVEAEKAKKRKLRTGEPEEEKKGGKGRRGKTE